MSGKSLSKVRVSLNSKGSYIYIAQKRKPCAQKHTPIKPFRSTSIDSNMTLMSPHQRQAIRTSLLTVASIMITMTSL